MKFGTNVLIDTNFCVKFHLINYNRSKACKIIIQFLIEALKLQNPKSNQFYVIKIQLFLHQNGLSTSFGIPINLSKEFKHRDKKICLKMIFLDFSEFLSMLV